MQRLRRKDPTGPDIESGTAAGGGPQSSPTPTSRTSPSRSALPPHNAVRAGGGTNGAGKFVTLLRKICLLTADDGRNPHGWVITIIKDVISGTILGVFFLMVLIFLDYRNISEFCLTHVDGCPFTDRFVTPRVTHVTNIHSSDD